MAPSLTISVSQRNDDVWCRNSSCSQVDQRQHKGSQRESAKTERSRVCKVALLLEVGTRLQVTTKGLKHARSFFSSHLTSEGVTAVVIARSAALITIGGAVGGSIALIGFTVRVLSLRHLEGDEALDERKGELTQKQNLPTGHRQEEKIRNGGIV